MPKPFPLFEIFVYSPQMEGIHLRGGMVARGGIRWSDRKEDYRTEVLGLMKAQKVKNAIIVPDGSKGGFVLKRATATPDELRAEVSTQYVTLMRGLLDITDNRVDGEVVHPAGVRVHDAPDPYLVVAADKGTATFSDTANAIASEYGFWLGDAFASGGSRRLRPQGARDHGPGRVGVGEAPLPRAGDRRHDRAVHRGGDRRHVGGRVRQRDALHAAIQLVVRVRPPARLHRSRPRPGVSFAERQRLFTIPRSSWADYDAALLSEGGASSTGRRRA